MSHEEEAKQMIKACARVLMATVLDLLQKDPHSWSQRPCSTCSAISTITGQDFGCVFYAKTGQRS